ncbi:CPBP family intramembrane metalloprotease [Sporosarcina sp. Marseille-Q4063]|uniref:CPBP family intramembrane glutamic endopeptidase n=1 Tax=Sporosarcina sp. Marseille-Q4063 TaxID=2810514 RepID=UPI001BB05F75|nr:CPBP family intramembrane glutamic endopeptidase [Sporosarcina sp. Marseille-Q4063]QUW20983.1 CPBP family intramembrane metalloprotease [Sporosarcina sp. Marseille-Q4063]
MLKGLLLALASIVFLLWIEQGIEVSYIWKTMAKVILFLVIPLILFRKTKLTFLSIKKTDRTSLRIAILSGLAVMFVIIAAFILLMPSIDIDSLLLDLIERAGVTATVFPFVALYILIGNSLLEEFFFRGLLPSFFKNNFFRLIIPSLLFAVYHVAIFLPWFNLPILLLAVLGLWVGGFIFQMVNERSGTILPSWIIHMFADVGVLLVGVYIFYFY